MKKTIVTSLLCFSVALTACSAQPQTDIMEDNVPETSVEETEPSETQVQVNRNQLFEDLQSGKTICFIGDSITEGAATDGIPWYQPLETFITGEVINVSVSGWTSVSLVQDVDEYPQADVYVIAIGINDVLYIDQAFGAATVEEFIDNLQTLSQMIDSVSPDSTMYFITPWPFLNFPDEAYETRDEFVEAMIEWCAEDDRRICIDPNDTIMSVLEDVDTSVYMWNDYHPDAPEGIGLYSYAVIQQDSIR